MGGLYPPIWVTQMVAGTWFGMYQAIWDRITAMYPEGLGNRLKPCPHDPFGNDAETPDSMLFIEVLIAGIIMLGVRFIRKTQINHETLTFNSDPDLDEMKSTESGIWASILEWFM